MKCAWKEPMSEGRAKVPKRRRAKRVLPRGKTGGHKEPRIAKKKGEAKE